MYNTTDLIDGLQQATNRALDIHENDNVEILRGFLSPLSTSYLLYRAMIYLQEEELKCDFDELLLYIDTKLNMLPCFEYKGRGYKLSWNMDMVSFVPCELELIPKHSTILYLSDIERLRIFLSRVNLSNADIDHIESDILFYSVFDTGMDRI